MWLNQLTDNKIAAMSPADATRLLDELELGAQLLFGQLVSLGVERVPGFLRLGCGSRARARKGVAAG